MATFRQMKDEIINEGCQLALKLLYCIFGGWQSSLNFLK